MVVFQWPSNTNNKRIYEPMNKALKAIYTYQNVTFVHNRRTDHFPWTPLHLLVKHISKITWCCQHKQVIIHLTILPLSSYLLSSRVRILITSRCNHLRPHIISFLLFKIIGQQLWLPHTHTALLFISTIYRHFFSSWLSWYSYLQMKENGILTVLINV